MITHFKKNLFCLIVTLPFYHAHATENPTSEQKHPSAEWTFTIKHTSPQLTREWLELIRSYIDAAIIILPDNTDKNFNAPTLQPFVGHLLATLLAQVSDDNGIHGALSLMTAANEESIDQQNSKAQPDHIIWKLELCTDDHATAETIDTCIKNLQTLTQELNEKTLPSSDQNYGSLLHGVAQQAQAGAPYTCHASLTLHT